MVTVLESASQLLVLGQFNHLSFSFLFFALFAFVVVLAFNFKHSKLVNDIL